MKLFFCLLFLLSGCAHRPRISGEGTVIRVAIQKEPLEVREIPIESYVIGVLAKEVHPDWPIESLKAQAVASRTYALYRKEHPRSASGDYDLEDTVQDQLFVEQKNPPSSLIQASGETAGEVLQYEGKIFPAFYHGSCGGIGEEAESVWPGEAVRPVNQIHPDPFCEASPPSNWSYELRKEEGEIMSIERSSTGRVTSLVFKSADRTQKISGNRLREMIGYQKIRSTLFDVEEEADRVMISGHGSGHGVGLCQWGAKGMGDQGFTYREILEFYYPGATLENPPLSPPL
ncbi:MAG: SpoIID/LytB domain-containing protein [Deltaproteobacteria bacterium]|nr:SpoIID/LytB domain-containing protein [Deltaproteobacteria bacterium]